MNIEQIRAPFRARPFRTFVIHTASGEAYTLKHPENMAITPDGAGLVVCPDPGQVSLIDVESVTEITYDFTRKPTNQVEA